MSGTTPLYDVAIVGGGLAGLMAAARVEELGASAVLIDTGLPGTPGGLGGFAPFSGAKFSLHPAGSGMASIVGGDVGLLARYRRACQHFAALGFPQFEVSDRQLSGGEGSAAQGLAHRRYHSVLLSPAEIGSLLSALASRLSRTKLVRAAATDLQIGSGPPFRVVLGDGGQVAGTRLIVAAGRIGAELLSSAGAPETVGKGMDVGIRLEFGSRKPVAGLRALGPDAKFMSGGMRTFCLNSPGRIFHYPGLGFKLPGGVVADADWPGANVGILCRLADRPAVLAGLRRRSPDTGSSPLSQKGHRRDLGWNASSREIVGERVADQVDGFVSQLDESGLIELPDQFTVHYPLLDWHWPVFSLPGRLATRVPGVFAAGDASGHARGLMQAVVMGGLAVEEAFL